MFLKRVRIKNFRSIQDIDLTIDSKVSIIVGPNATGKTSILEAIRLCKAVLAPRTQNEAQQVFVSLGAISPHMPQTLQPKAITQNPKTPTSIKCTYYLNEGEVKSLKDSKLKIALNIVRQRIGTNFSNPAQMAAFFSSASGKSAIESAEKEVSAEMEKFSDKGIYEINLNLNIEYSSGNIAGENQLHQVFFSTIEQELDPMETIFSYFPADRAMKVGDQQVQLGAGDASNQLEAHNSQPHLKYERLKSTIFNAIVRGQEERDNIYRQFELLFSKILKGKKLGDIGLNDLGMLSITIEENETGVKFDIDGLSSGEKGLILTFLMISRAVSNHGIILLDEPELHLNPSVCRDLLDFFLDEYVIKKDLQAIICTHSADILAGALNREECTLYHNRSGTNPAKIRHKDRSEIRDALRRLGTSESEALLYKGTISVEGVHDVEILENGFDDTFRRYRIKNRGGRNQIEKDINELQKAEINGDEIGYHYFIFDHDGKPSALRDSKRVKILQISRYCMENYLLDPDLITDLSNDKDFSENPFRNTTQTRDKLKSIALNQIHNVAARHAFSHLGLEKICFDMTVFQNEDPQDVTSALLVQVKELSKILGERDEPEFKAEFSKLYNEKKNELDELWDDKWPELCNGKKVFEDLRREKLIKGDLLKIKKKISSEMKSRKTETWNSMTNIFREMLERSTSSD